jgi:ABC-type nitrate/sulfonate/bicarbonate transport system substrate-binding protein
VQSSQFADAVLIGPGTWIADHPTAADRFLWAIQEADDWIRDNQADARCPLRDRLGMDGSRLETEWPRHQFSLSLDQSLVLA